jgi:hypothetical protein
MSIEHETSEPYQLYLEDNGLPIDERTRQRFTVLLMERLEQDGLFEPTCDVEALDEAVGPAMHAAKRQLSKEVDQRKETIYMRKYRLALAVAISIIPLSGYAFVFQALPRIPFINEVLVDQDD